MGKKDWEILSMAHLQPNRPFGNDDSTSTWENLKNGIGSKKVGNLWVRGAQNAPSRRGWYLVKLWTLEMMQIQINYSLFFIMQRGRCHLKSRKKCKINKKNSPHRLRVILPAGRWCGDIKDPHNHGARSIPDNNPSILSCHFQPGWPQSSWCWDFGMMDPPWSFSPTGFYLLTPSTCRVHCAHVQPTPAELLCPISL